MVVTSVTLRAVVTNLVNVNGSVDEVDLALGIVIESAIVSGIVSGTAIGTETVKRGTIVAEMTTMIVIAIGIETVIASDTIEIGIAIGERIGDVAIVTVIEVTVNVSVTAIVTEIGLSGESTDMSGLLDATGAALGTEIRQASRAVAEPQPLTPVAATSAREWRV